MSLNIPGWENVLLHISILPLIPNILWLYFISVSTASSPHFYVRGNHRASSSCAWVYLVTLLSLGTYGHVICLERSCTPTIIVREYVWYKILYRSLIVNKKWLKEIIFKLHCLNKKWFKQMIPKYIVGIKNDWNKSCLKFMVSI